MLRLVKTGRAADKKPATAREQRFRFPAEEVWEVSCGPAKNRPAHNRDRQKAS